MDAELGFFAETKPDVEKLRQAYEYTIAEVTHYAEQCRASFDDRRCYWPGKSNDLRKHGANAFPWEGASDIEVPLIAEKMNTYVSMCMAALKRSNIRAYPVEVSDTGRAQIVSSFLKWMASNYIENFYRNMESNANWLFEKGMIVSYVGWHSETRTFLQELNLEQIAQSSPELAEIIVNGEDDYALIELFRQEYPDLIEKRAIKALKELRKTGVAKLPVSKKKIDAPIAVAVPADGDVFFPPYTLEPQEATQIFYRVYMTPQQLHQKATTDGWDQAWVDYVIEHYRGKTNYQLNSQYNNRISSGFGSQYPNDTDYIEVVYCYQRLIDKEDGSEGIYCTVFHPEWTGEPDEQKRAKHELLNGLEDYPFVVTRLSEQSRRLYDVETFGDLLRGIQWQVKVERDSRIDKASISTLPTMRGPAGRPPADVGPGRYVGERRKGEYDYMPAPPYSPDSVQMENVLIQQANELIGLDVDSPLSNIKQQYYVDKFLTHARDVLRMGFKMYQLYGPDELMFRVSGVSEAQKFEKGDPSENFDILVTFDTQQHDPETQEKKLGQMVNLMQMDKNGRINGDKMIEIAANSIDPVLADSVIESEDVSTDRLVKQVTDDLSKIYAGIERPGLANGQQIGLSIVQQYAQQPDIAQRLQGDEGFAERLSKYAQQMQMDMQQMQNAQIGREGTAPAAVGNTSTQDIR